MNRIIVPGNNNDYQQIVNGIELAHVANCLESISWTRESELVYCPMCEHMHVNDTNCQRND